MFRPKSLPLALFGTLVTSLIVTWAVYAMWNDFGPDNVGFAIASNFMLMTWAVICTRLLNPTFASAYFESKPFERDGMLYRHFGVLLFRRLLIVSRWDASTNKDRKSLRTLEGLHEFEHRTKASEASHGVIAIIVCLMTLVAFWQGSWMGGVLLMLSNLFFNIYPVMLQRYNRPITQKKIRSWSNE